MRRNEMLLVLGIAMIFHFATPLFSQVTCVYPPPSGPNALFTKVTQQHLDDFDLQKLQSPRNSARPPEGTWKALVLLVDFPNYRWHTSSDSNFVNPDSLYAPQHFREMLFSEGVYGDPASASPYTGSLRDFYLANSYGRSDIVGEVAGWFTAKNNLEYYLGGAYGLGSYPNNAQRLVEEAVALADSTVDFREYDNDGNGIVDALLIVHAGPAAEYVASVNPAAAPRYFWSHFGGINSRRVDEVLVSGYAMMPEDGTIGVFCHELGHGLGLPDLYDPDGSSEGLGEWCLMGSGSWCYKTGDRLGTSPSYLSAWSRFRLGWATPLSFSDGETVRLQPIESTDNILILQNSSMPSREYFLLENRQPLGFDAGLTRRQKDFGLSPPAGLMIYHIDETGSSSIDRRRLVDVEEATPYLDDDQTLEQMDRRREPPNHLFINRGNRGDNGDPFPGFAAWADDLTDFTGPRSRDRFDDSSVPSSQTNSGVLTGIAVSEIQFDNLDVLCRVQLQGTTAVAAAPHIVPEAVTLSVTPNPVVNGFQLRGRLPQGSRMATGRLFDVLGRELFAAEIRAAEDGSFTWMGEKPASLPAGIYFSVVESGARRAVAKITVLR